MKFYIGGLEKRLQDNTLFAHSDIILFFERRDLETLMLDKRIIMPLFYPIDCSFVESPNQAVKTLSFNLEAVSSRTNSTTRKQLYRGFYELDHKNLVFLILNGCKRSEPIETNNAFLL